MGKTYRKENRKRWQKGAKKHKSKFQQEDLSVISFDKHKEKKRIEKLLKKEKKSLQENNEQDYVNYNTEEKDVA